MYALYFSSAAGTADPPRHLLDMLERIDVLKAALLAGEATRPRSTPPTARLFTAKCYGSVKYELDDMYRVMTKSIEDMYDHIDTACSSYGNLTSRVPADLALGKILLGFVILTHIAIAILTQ